jgi:hypothetical protein
MDNYKLTGAYYPPSDYEEAEGKAPAGWLKFSSLVDSCRQANETVVLHDRPVVKELEGETIDFVSFEESDAVELALFDRLEARAINRKY